MQLSCLQQKLLKHSPAEELFGANLRYVTHFGLDKKDASQCDCPVGYTNEHVGYILENYEAMQKHRILHAKILVDLKKFQNEQTEEKLKNSIL